jgi:hypothetical protein
MAVLMVIIFLVYVVALRFPISFKHEHVIRRLLRRYFAAMDSLLDTIHVDRRFARSWWERQRRDWDMMQLRTIPAKLLPWVKFMPSEAVTPADKAELMAFIQSLAVLSMRLEDLREARGLRYSDAQIAALLGQLRGWREAMQSLVADLSKGQEGLLHADYREKLDARMARIENILKSEIAEAGSAPESVEEGRSLYRLLAAFRGTSEALLRAMGCGAGVDWVRLREARF